MCSLSFTSHLIVLKVLIYFNSIANLFFLFYHALECEYELLRNERFQIYHFFLKKCIYIYIELKYVTYKKDSFRLMIFNHKDDFININVSASKIS